MRRNLVAAMMLILGSSLIAHAEEKGGGQPQICEKANFDFAWLTGDWRRDAELCDSSIRYICPGSTHCVTPPSRSIEAKDGRLNYTFPCAADESESPTSCRDNLLNTGRRKIEVEACTMRVMEWRSAEDRKNWELQCGQGNSASCRKAQDDYERCQKDKRRDSKNPCPTPPSPPIKYTLHKCGCGGLPQASSARAHGDSERDACLVSDPRPGALR